MYTSPNANVDGFEADTTSKTRRIFQFAVFTFLVNSALAAITIYMNSQIGGPIVKYTAYLWIVATVTYSFFVGYYFSRFGKYKWIWGIVALVTQPIGILFSIVFVVFRAKKHGWHINS